MHWACKRDHTPVIQYLLATGADANIATFKGETVTDLASSNEALSLLGCPLEERMRLLKLKNALPLSALPIVPHYLQHPTFPYSEPRDQSEDNTMANGMGKGSSNPLPDLSLNQQPPDDHNHDFMTSKLQKSQPNSLLLKIRVFEGDESDFIEVELCFLTYGELLKICAEELEINSTRISKIRKLPDTLIRKDQDVQRLSEGQRLEVVLKKL